MLDGGRSRRADRSVPAPDAECHDPGRGRRPGRSPPRRPRPWAISFIYALGNTFWRAPRSPPRRTPPSVLTAMPRPSPSGSSAAFTAVRRTSGMAAGRATTSGSPWRRPRRSPIRRTHPRASGRRCGHVSTRRPPRAGPARRRGPGRTSPAPTAKATAEAEWPDGMEELVGCGWTNLNTGRCSGRGRARGSSVLKPTLVTAEATACARNPWTAARRVFPGKAAMTAAVPIQSLPLFAEAESRRKKSSWLPPGRPTRR